MLALLTPLVERDCPLVVEEENGQLLGPNEDAIKLSVCTSILYLYMYTHCLLIDIYIIYVYMFFIHEVMFLME